MRAGRAPRGLVVAAVAEAQRAVGARPSVMERSRAGSAAKVLLDEAEDADLLVIGRGHRAGVVDVLGHSVSAEMVLHAKRPTTDGGMRHWATAIRQCRELAAAVRSSPD